MHVSQSLFLDNGDRGPFSIFSPAFITVAHWLLVTGDKGHERTRNARGRQLFLNPAEHSVKYFWSVTPALWQSPKKEISVQSQGQMDYLGWQMSHLIGVACMPWETEVFPVVALCPWINQLGLWPPVALWCLLVAHNSPPGVGSLTALDLTHLLPVTMKCYPRWKGSRKISWWIQDGLFLKSDRQKHRLILVNICFFLPLPLVWA